MNTENLKATGPSSDAENQAVDPRKMSRRKALAIVGKHAVYTAPAVLAVLSLTKSGDADANTCPPGASNC